MAKTSPKAHTAHLAHLFRLALTVLAPHYAFTTAGLVIDARMMSEGIAIANQIAARYEGDHTAWRQIRANTEAALAHMGRIAAVNGFEAVEDGFVTLRELCRSYLAGLTHEQRVQLASFDGFANAHLVEENHEPGQDPALVTWLNPVYASDSAYKQRIQEAANRRYAERYPSLNVADLADMVA